MFPLSRRNTTRASWRASTLLAMALVAVAGSGCVQYPDAGASRDSRRLDGGRRLRPATTLKAITAPVVNSGERELSRLGTDHGSLLRRGWILMETRRPQEALHIVNRVLHASPRPSSNTLGLAHFLRARAFLYQGQRTLALAEYQKANHRSQRADVRRISRREIARLGGAKRAPAAVEPAPASSRRGGSIQFVPRHRWNAGRPVLARLDPMRGIYRMTIHHSATLSRDASQRAVAAQIRGIQGHHIRTNGWGDIGYHFLIDPAGRVWEGRALSHQGAHAGGVNNEHNVGVCLLGNFTPGRGGQVPTREQVGAMQDLVQWLGSRYSIARAGVLTHKELKPETSCPGTRLQSIVNRMRRYLAATPAVESATRPGK